MIKKISFALMILLSCIAVFFIIFLNRDDKEKGISRAIAFRQAAIVLGYSEDSVFENYFSEDDDSYWFISYINYLYENEYADTELTEPDGSTIAENITNEEVFNMLTQCKYDFTDMSKTAQLEDIIESLENTEAEVIDKDRWYYILDLLIGIYDKNDLVRKEELTLFATPAYIHELAAWNGVTDKGVYCFEGFAIDSYVDTKLNVVFFEEQVLRIEPVEDYAEYKNVIVYEKDSSLVIQLKGYERQFKLDSSIGTEGYMLADVNVSKGSISKIKLKNEKISGAIHTIKDGLIDIEGYDTLELDENVHIFKSYGDTKELTMNDLIVGYDVYEFIVAENKICGIYMVREADAEKIRVVISTSEYKALYHDEIICSSEKGLKVVSGSETTTVAAGEFFSVNKESTYFNNGRIVIEALDGGKILFSNISRKSGEALYPGKIELSLTSDGILMINEVYLEDYLKLVLPSEMPSGYSMEALKAQAVCARSYAYRHIMNNSYAELGAHVDDTTTFQVYNNLAENENTSRAVDETYGKVLFYGDEPTTTYYYSTSWGYSTDVSMWGNDVSALPYLSGVKLSDAEECNVTDNEVFSQLIKSKNTSDWECECPWYRWNISLDIDTLSKTINENISEYSLNNIEDVEVLQEDGSFLPQYVDTLGEIKKIEVQGRGTGGIVNRLLIEGSENTVILNKAGAVRNVLGSKASVYTKNDGTTADGQKYLPSGYFIIEDILENDELKGYKITGGGFGHGVGMSQNGANELAKKGKNYEEILLSFYPGTGIHDIKESGV